MFESICRNYPFWDNEKALQAKPEFSPCFEDTVLVWIPYGYLWLTLVPYLIYLSRRDHDPPLPFTTPLMIIKTILTVFLFALALTDALLTHAKGYRCAYGGDVPSSLYIADGVKAGTFLLVLILEQYMRILGVKSSGVPFVFWLLVTVADIVPLYSVSTAGIWCSTSTLLCIEVVFLCLQLLLRCFADQYKNRGYHRLDPDPCPEENASVLNKITFSWITSLVVKAYKQTLTSKDLWTQTRRLQSKRVVGHFLRNWKLIKNKLIELRLSRTKEQYHTYSRYSKDYNSERTPLLANNYGDEHGANNISFGTLHADTGSKEGPSIFKVLIKSFGWLWVEACGYKIIGDAVNLMQPIILSYIIDVIERKDGPDALPVWIGFTYAVALFLTSMIKSLVWQTCLQNMIGLGLTIKTALIGAVYRKALTLSNSAKKTSTVGEIVNLMSVDCQRVQDAFTFSHHIISLPFVSIVAMVQLWALMGVAMFGGLAVLVVAVVINGILGRMQQRLQIQILRNKSKRVKILNEVINGIKVLKMYTWETPFQNKVSAIRKEEIIRLWKYAMLTAVAMLFSIHSPFMVNYMLVLVYTLAQSVHYLDAQTAFVALSLVNILRGPITLTPFVINGVIQGYVSLFRIQAFLWKDDINEDNVEKAESGDYMINIEKGIFTWDRKDHKPTLTGIDLKLPEGKIYAVVGQVGCGKSSLISAILGEMEKVGGTVNLRGKIAYVPQEAWIQNLTVRDNIIFGNEWDLDRYNKVLTGCAMIPDLEMLSGGDMTEIGEKGINISGGQKQRVSLARAVYSDADIYLLDDPLSAVDSHVGKHLFKNVIGSQGLLKRKTRILVTHGIHWLPMVDKILVITNGRISESGTYEELISRDGPFANLVQTYLENNDESDGDDTDVRAENNGPEDTTTSKSSTRRRRHKSSEREKSFGMSFTKEHSSNKDMKRNDQLMSRLVQEEQSQKGAVKFAVFQKYAKSMGYTALLFVMLFMVGFQSLNVFSNYWLTYWTEDELMKNKSLGYTAEYEERYVYYLVCYTVIGVIQGAAIFAFGALALTRMVRASGILHNSMLECILRSPMSFFDTTPVGRIMNRFSSDIDVMDDRLPLNFRLWNIQIFSTIATIIVVSINTPIFMVVIVPVTIVYLMLLKFFLPTARQVKRLESVLRSPIYNHFSETISGVSVIRAYKCMDRFIEESEKRIDTNIKFFFAALSASRWIAIRLEMLGNILILAATIFALISNDLNGAEVGLSITYSLQITISLNLVIQAVSEMEMNIVSAERVKEYTELHPEAPWSIKSRRPSSEWPRTGSIEFRLFRTRYREGLELTLKGISCQIRSGEKIGIVGRTGAGKSSMALSLFRLIESAGGAIIIDGQNVADIGLHDLRSKLTILPQDPVLFSGTLRENLDPFGKHDEPSIWKSLECAHLKNAVDHMSGQLEYECGEGGSNLSVGQRQLVCLARTLLHKTKVLILDEATAAVDLETDELIQETIRTEFRDCTILTIAHRLNTVLDYDRVLVLSEGRILELDAPGKLLQDPSSVFFKMAKDAGLVS